MFILAVGLDRDSALQDLVRIGNHYEMASTGGGKTAALTGI